VTGFGSFEETSADSPYPGILRRVVTTAKATVTEYRFEPGATFPIHAHPEEQITLVLEGDIAFTAGAERRELGAGAWSVVPGEIGHGVTAGPTGARFLAIVVPPRSI
jgi:quercetin dioxygenase-like cupin family protein